ncbi:MAG: von Willebrand factor type A domain-containing protein [Prosthecobacter sp.]|uniref:vWA domain-containing protein n=1 Tax=Prosthecobacter sp. TaxID=1965333 RepID=UPI0039020C5E
MKPEQITAWALNEASADERQQFEAALRDNPKAKQAAEDTKDFCHFLLAELRDESLALTDAQRERLKTQPLNAVVHSDELKPELPTKWRFSSVVKLAMAASIALGGLWTWHALGPQRATPQIVQAEETKYKVLPVGRGDVAVEKDKIETARRSQTLSPAKPGKNEVKKEALALDRLVTAVPAPATESQPTETPMPLALNKSMGTLSASDVVELKKIEDQRAYGLTFSSLTAATAAPAAPLPGLIVSNTSSPASGPVSALSIAPNTSTTFGGAISGSGGLNKTGAGTLTLGGSTNQFAGDLTVNTGTLRATAAPTSRTSLVRTASGIDAGSGAVAAAGTGAMTLNGGTLTTSASTPATPAALQLAGGVVEFDGFAPLAQTVDASGTVAGSGDLTKDGAGKLTLSGGTLRLSGANTYTGGTTVRAGTLAVSNTAPMPMAAPGATLDLNGKNETLGALTVTNGAVNGLDVGGVVSGSGIGSGSFVSVVFGNAVTNDDALYYNGAGTSVSRDQARIVGGRAEQKDEKAKTTPAQPSNETYTRIIENELKEVAREPLSTLSIDVDTASYANVRRFLNQNMAPPPDAVRIEELVNYFPTSEEGPAAAAKEPFGVRVEMAPCPWQPEHRLTRIAIKGREMDKDRKASNLVFLVDVSGSMDEPLKLPLVQQSLRMLTEQLGEGDRVTMVAYAGSSGLVLPPTSGEKKGEIIAAIDRLKAGGSTHGSAGIQLAYEQAVSCFIKGGVNRVILCTDGDFNVGVSSPKELEKLITQKAKSGVFLSVLGFGSGNLKDRTMETLADKGNGNYAYIDSLSEARKVLVEQMSGTLITIAKDVKIQVEFNPAAVRSYRLIGYENRLLAKEDFNNDAKDAGEIGAGHSVVALYEVVPANLPPGAEPRPLVDGLKYQTAAAAPVKLADAAKNGEVMTVKLRYKEPEGMTSRLIEVPVKDEGKTLTASSEEFKFSAAVAGFGLLLRDSGYKGNLSWETVRKLGIDGKGTDKLGYRGEFLQLIDKARGLKGQ